MYRDEQELSAPNVVKPPCLAGWRKRVDEAEKRGEFTVDEKNRASNWDLCACGEARDLGFEWARYARYGGFGLAPEDSELLQLGYRFCDEVDDDEFAKCRITLTAIEQRLAETFA